MIWGMTHKSATYTRVLYWILHGELLHFHVREIIWLGIRRCDILYVWLFMNDSWFSRFLSSILLILIPITIKILEKCQYWCHSKPGFINRSVGNLHGPWISYFEIRFLPWMNPIRTRIRKTRIVFHVRIRPSMILWSPKRTRLEIDPGVFRTCS